MTVTWHTVESIVSHRVGFFDRVNSADNQVKRGANQVDFYSNRVSLSTIESIRFHNQVGFSIESIFITNESTFITIESILETHTTQFLD